MIKACVNCGLEKDETQFHLRLKGYPQRRRLCKQCEKIARDEHPRGKSGPSGKSRVQRFGGLTEEEYQSKLLQQKGVCKICGGTGKRRLAVDHDHQTDTVRALLCGRCNLGLGYFRDNPELLTKAADYLMSYK